MKRAFLAFLFVLAFCVASIPAQAADYPACVSVTTAATTVLPATSIKGGRHRLLVQNIGGTNAAVCKVGGATVTATTGFSLAPGASLSESASVATPGAPSPYGATVPGGAVQCITAASTTTVCAGEF